MTPKTISFYFIISSFLFHGCSLVEADTLPGKTTGDQVYRNNNTATKAVIDVYENISGKLNFLASGAAVYSGINCGELVYNGQNEQILDFWNGNISTKNTTLETSFWNTSYIIIRGLNVSILGLSGNNLPDTSLRKQLMGECLMLRATMYFYMSQFFGDVPLVTTPDYIINETMPRTPLITMKKMIVDDLQEAKKLLTNEYPGVGRARANKFAAAALLARIYLYDNNYTMAVSEANEIINSGMYQLESLNNVFLINSSEAILQIQPILNNVHTMDGITFIPRDNNAKPNFSIAPDLLIQFENGDDRKSKWIETTVVGGITYKYPFKYKKRADQPTEFKLSEYTTIFRLAEVYLIRAESYAAQGLLQAAIHDVDLIRQRAKLPLIASTNPRISASQLSDLIQHERRIELFAELGHYWMDLKRSGKLNELLTNIKPNWKEERVLWPIPENQIELNRNLKQNPGYK